MLLFHFELYMHLKKVDPEGVSVMMGKLQRFWFFTQKVGSQSLGKSPPGDLFLREN